MLYVVSTQPLDTITATTLGTNAHASSFVNDQSKPAQTHPNNNESTVPNSAPSSSASSPTIDNDTILFEGKVLTKHSRLVVLSLHKNNIAWQEKGTSQFLFYPHCIYTSEIVRCTVPLSTIIGVTTIHKFFTIHYVVSS